MANIDFDKLTPSNGAVQNLRQLLFLTLSTETSLAAEVNFLPGQKHGEKVGFIGEFGMLGKAATGCNPTYENSLLSTAEKTWSIKKFQIAEKICYDELETTLKQIANKQKMDADDLTDSEYLNDIILPRLERAYLKAFKRLAWFGDESYTASDMKVSGNQVYFNIVDGLWKRFFTAVTAGTVKRVTISANAQTTVSSQKTAILGAGVATGIVENMVMEASPELREQDNVRVYMTQALADALTLDYRHNNKGSDLQWNALANGISTSRYAGIEIWAMPYWDSIIQGELKNTTNTGAYMLPFRAVMTIKDNLLVGSESENEMAAFSINFNNETRLNTIFGKDSVGSLIADEKMAVVAY